MSDKAPARPARILIVDDDPDLAAILSEVLTNAGYDTGMASNGQEALATLHNDRAWDLVLLDLMMPVMNGWEFRTEQLRLPEISAIPIVAFSGGANVQQASLTLGAAAALRKPIGRTELLVAVEQVLRREGAAAQ